MPGAEPFGGLVNLNTAETSIGRAGPSRRLDHQHIDLIERNAEVRKDMVQELVRCGLTEEAAVRLMKLSQGG